MAEQLNLFEKMVETPEENKKEEKKEVKKMKKTEEKEVTVNRAKTAEDITADKIFKNIIAETADIKVLGKVAYRCQKAAKAKKADKIAELTAQVATLTAQVEKLTAENVALKTSGVQTTVVVKKAHTISAQEYNNGDEDFETGNRCDGDIFVVDETEEDGGDPIETNNDATDEAEDIEIGGDVIIDDDVEEAEKAADIEISGEVEIEEDIKVENVIKVQKSWLEVPETTVLISQPQLNLLKGRLAKVGPEGMKPTGITTAVADVFCHAWAEMKKLGYEPEYKNGVIFVKIAGETAEDVQTEDGGDPIETDEGDIKTDIGEQPIVSETDFDIPDEESADDILIANLLLNHSTYVPEIKTVWNYAQKKFVEKEVKVKRTNNPLHMGEATEVGFKVIAETDETAIIAVGFKGSYLFGKKKGDDIVGYVFGTIFDEFGQLKDVDSTVKAIIKLVKDGELLGEPYAVSKAALYAADGYQHGVVKTFVPGTDLQKTITDTDIANGSFSGVTIEEDDPEDEIGDYNETQEAFGAAVVGLEKKLINVYGETAAEVFTVFRKTLCNYCYSNLTLEGDVFTFWYSPNSFTPPAKYQIVFKDDTLSFELC